MTEKRPQQPAGGRDDEPLSPEQERIVRRMRGFMVVGALIMFAGIAVVLSTIVFRLFNTPETADAPSVDGLETPVAAELPLAPGERIAGATTTGGLVTVTTEGAGGGRVLIFDLETLTLRRELAAPAR